LVECITIGMVLHLISVDAIQWIGSHGPNKFLDIQNPKSRLLV